MLVTSPILEPVTLSEIKQHLRLDSGLLADTLTTVQSISPASYGVSVVTGTAVNVLGHQVLVNLDAGICTGSVAVKIQESDDAITYTDWTDGAFTTVTSANDEAIQEKEYTGLKTYIRVVATITGAACVFGVSVIKSQPYSPEDELLSGLISAAREYCEGVQHRAYYTQTHELWLDEWPEKDFIELDPMPVQVVNYVKYYDVNDTVYTLAEATYYQDLISEPGRVVLNYEESWPSEVLRPANAIVVNFDAGFNSVANVPARTKQAIKLLVGHWYKNREAVGDVARNSPLEWALKSLLFLDRKQIW